MMVDIKDEGFEAFEKDLDYIIKNMPRESRMILRKMGAKARVIIRKKVRQSVKRKTGNFERRWRYGRVYQREAGSWMIRVYNNAPHAHLIEDGHRIVGKDGSEHGFVQGKKVIDLANSELENVWEKTLRKETEKIVKKI